MGSGFHLVLSKQNNDNTFPIVFFYLTARRRNRWPLTRDLELVSDFGGIALHHVFRPFDETTSLFNMP